MAYQLLRVAARKRTEYLVIEAAAAAVTDEGEEETPVVREIRAAGLIPVELLDIVQGEVRNFVIDDDDDDELVRLSLHNHPYEANNRVEFVRLDVGMDARL